MANPLDAYNPFAPQVGPYKTPNGSVSGTTSTTPPTQPANSTIDQLLAALGKTQQPNALADLGSVLGGFSSGEKANRVVEGNFQGDFDRMMLDRENRMNTLGLQAQADRNVNEADALRKLQQTSYIGGGGSQYSPISIMLNGQNRQLPSFAGIAPTRTTAAEQQGATDLQGQVMNRLKPGGSFQPEWNYTPRPVEEYAKPGGLEKFGSYGGAIAGGLGSIDRMTGGRIGSAIGKGLGKAGGAIGGLLGLGGGAAGAAGGLGTLAGAPIYGAGGSLLGTAGSSAAAAGAGAGGAGFMSGLGALATNPWTIGIAGGLLAAKPLINKLRGGEEGIYVNPARDKFIGQFGPPGSVTDVNSGANALAEALQKVDPSGQAYNALSSADSRREYDNAVTVIQRLLAGKR